MKFKDMYGKLFNFAYLYLITSNQHSVMISPHAGLSSLSPVWGKLKSCLVFSSESIKLMYTAFLYVMDYLLFYDLYNSFESDVELKRRNHKLQVCNL